MHSLESFGLRDADIKVLDEQYATKAKMLRLEAQAEASDKRHAEWVAHQAKVQAEQEEREKVHNGKLDESFRIASILIEKAFGDADVTRISHRDDFIENNGTSRSSYFPIWMFNDGAARCYCVSIQHGSYNHSHKWFYSVMRSCSVLPSSSYNRYSKGITSGGNYEVKALSHDFDKVVPVVMKHGRVVMDDDVASVCSDDREIKCPCSFADVDTSSIESGAIDIDDSVYDEYLDECLDDDIVDDSYNKY